jgi:Subtilisin inhibitor-like
MVMNSLTSRRPRIIAVRCTTVLAIGLLAAACGGTGAPRATSGGSPAATPAAAARISLDVDFAGSPTTRPEHYTLRCEPAGGSVARPAAACAKLLKDAGIFGPLPAHVPCPMIMASAGRATVTGIYLGRHVHESIVDGGCDLARWAKLRQVFG